MASTHWVVIPVPGPTLTPHTAIVYPIQDPKHPLRWTVLSQTPRATCISAIQHFLGFQGVNTEGAQHGMNPFQWGLELSRVHMGAAKRADRYGSRRKTTSLGQVLLPKVFLPNLDLKKTNKKTPKTCSQRLNFRVEDRMDHRLHCRGTEDGTQRRKCIVSWHGSSVWARFKEEISDSRAGV